MRSVIKETERTAAGAVLSITFRYHRVVGTEIQLVADTDLQAGSTSTSHRRVLRSAHTTGNTSIRAPVSLITIQTGREYLRIVEYKYVFIIKVVQNILNILCSISPVRRLLHHQTDSSLYFVGCKDDLSSGNLNLVIISYLFLVTLIIFRRFPISCRSIHSLKCSGFQVVFQTDIPTCADQSVRWARSGALRRCHAPGHGCYVPLTPRGLDRRFRIVQTAFKQLYLINNKLFCPWFHLFTFTGQFISACRPPCRRKGRGAPARWHQESASVFLPPAPGWYVR